MRRRLRNRERDGERETKRQEERCTESGVVDIDHQIWQELSCFC